MNLNSIIVDDSTIQRLSIVKLVENHESLNLIAEYSNPLEAKDGLKKHQIDLIFNFHPTEYYHRTLKYSNWSMCKA